MTGFWLFLALAIPLAIHIFSRSEGKVVPFPFLDLLPQQATPSELQIQLYQKWRLLLRLLLVASACSLLTLALLSEWWSESWLKQSLTHTFSVPASPPTLIITQDWWEVSTQQDKQVLFDLLTSDTNFSEIKALILIHYAHQPDKISHIKTADFLQRAQDNTVFVSAKVSSDAEGLRLIDNIGAIVQVVSTSTPSDSTIHIYTSNRHSQFVGGHPAINHAVKWQISELSIINQDPPRPIRVAVIENNQSKAATQINFLLKQALAALALVHPIEVAYLDPKAFANALNPLIVADDGYLNEDNDTISSDNKGHSMHSELLSYDALIINIPDVPDNNIAKNYANLTLTSSLPSPFAPDFIVALGQVVFAKIQQEQTLLSSVISKQQIEQQTSATENVPDVSAIPQKHEHPWRNAAVVILLVLFVLERFISEFLKDSPNNTSVNKHD